MGFCISGPPAASPVETRLSPRSSAGAATWGGGLVNIMSVSNIVLSGITFEGSVGPLVYISGGQNNLISNCNLNGSLTEWT